MIFEVICIIGRSGFLAAVSTQRPLLMKSLDEAARWFWSLKEKTLLPLLFLF